LFDKNNLLGGDIIWLRANARVVKMMKVINGILDALKTRDDVILVILFGSFLRDEEYNDIDVLVVCERGSQLSVEEGLLRISKQGNTRLDLVVYEKPEFLEYLRRGDPFLTNVIISGRVILLRDDDLGVELQVVRKEAITRIKSFVARNLRILEGRLNALGYRGFDFLMKTVHMLCYLIAMLNGKFSTWGDVVRFLADLGVLKADEMEFLSKYRRCDRLVGERESYILVTIGRRLLAYLKAWVNPWSIQIMRRLREVRNLVQGVDFGRLGMEEVLYDVLGLLESLGALMEVCLREIRYLIEGDLKSAEASTFLELIDFAKGSRKQIEDLGFKISDEDLLLIDLARKIRNTIYHGALDIMIEIRGRNLLLHHGTFNSPEVRRRLEKVARFVARDSYWYVIINYSLTERLYGLATRLAERTLEVLKSRERMSGMDE